MSGLTPRQTYELQFILREAIVQCSERCLYQSAKWVAELLSSTDAPPGARPGPNGDQADLRMEEDVEREVAPIVFTRNHDPEEAALEAREIGNYLLAKSFFDCREYDRCAAVFLPRTMPTGPVLNPATVSMSGHAQKPSKRTPTTATSATAKGKSVKNSFPKTKLPPLSQKALFLSLYARFMAGEKRKDEESEMILGPQDGASTVNQELGGILAILGDWFEDRTIMEDEDSSSQGWLEYLYGIVLAKAKNDDQARGWLIRSVTLYSHNWGAWLELGSLIGSTESLESTLELLPHNLMTQIFFIVCSQELYQWSDAVLSVLTGLDRIFPSSHFLQTQRALLMHHQKDYAEAESIFSALIQEDPHRIDSLDHFSNILYVMGNRPKLAFLAQLASATDKFRPETCCVIGNYYALKSEHEKAVMYFRRALTLDRSCTSAWILMGHEYVELKNTHAAIESYRRAVDVNRKDYRAWYGLGQTYEMLEMHYYALFYHQRAAALHPYDPSTWQAVGSCFAKMERPTEAIKAYKRALVVGDSRDPTGSFGSGSSGPAAGGSGGGGMDPDILYQIALQYESAHDFVEASAYMELTLQQEDGNLVGDEDEEEAEEDGLDGQGRERSGGVGVTATTSSARMWLAKWEFSRGRLTQAMSLAEQLCQDGVEVEDAKALVRDLRARMEQVNASSSP